MTGCLPTPNPVSSPAKISVSQTTTPNTKKKPLEAKIKKPTNVVQNTAIQPQAKEKPLQAELKKPTHSPLAKPIQNVSTNPPPPKCIGRYNSNTWHKCFGKRTFNNGTFYEGNWRNGKYEGFGTKTYKFFWGWEIKKYVGEFSKGLRDGYGTATYGARGVREGTWKKGKFISNKEKNYKVFKIQTSLKNLGLYEYSIDGINGSKTKISIRDWQKCTGYDQTGKLTIKQYIDLTRNETKFFCKTEASLARLSRPETPRVRSAPSKLQSANTRPQDDRFRIALVIGNGAYKTEGSLRNPPNDADLMAGTLRDLGWKVTLKKNVANKNEFKGFTKKFFEQIKENAEREDTVALFYYSGHGVQQEGKSYLIPVKAKIDEYDDIGDQAIGANWVLKRMGTAKAKVNIMILDACRNNSLPVKNRSSSKGLAEITIGEDISDTLVAYSAKLGSVAEDGKGKYSEYTSALSETMKVKSLTIDHVFQKVTKRVKDKTGNRQIPEKRDSLTAPFYFSPWPSGTK